MWILCHSTRSSGLDRRVLVIEIFETVSLGVLLDKNLKDHINTIKNKISKSIGLILRAKNVLNKDSLTKLLYHIRCYLNCGNMGWGSTHKTKLHKIYLKQNIQFVLKVMKANLRILSHSCDPCLYWMFQKILVFMHRFKNCSNVPSIFANKFTYHSHRHPTNFSKNDFTLPEYLSHKSKYKISNSGLSLWNKVLSNNQKEL